MEHTGSSPTTCPDPKFTAGDHLSQAPVGALAREALALTRDCLMVSLRFLDVALCALEWRSSGEDLWATDGTGLYYDAREVLARYKGGRERLSRDYLHTVLHCVLSHPFTGSPVRPDCWNLACDITVEAIIHELGLPAVTPTIEADQRPILRQLEKAVKSLTAERIYRHLLDQAMPEATVADWQRLFFRDEHDRWSGLPHREQSDDMDEGQGDRQVAEKRWKEIGERIGVDLDTVSQMWGDKAGSLTRNVRAATRERVRFREFLRRFMALGEVMKVDMDTFDYVYYNYGMARYGNMPLIEPLEYKDERRIRDFVIAIDTSASCSGDLVQAFVDKVCAIFRQSENFFRKFNVHIIQCDAAIQSVIHLESLADFAGLQDRIRLCGFGGTDFRPVFRLVDQMIAEQQLTDLKGLIYFTDGYGRFPEKKPAYETAFVFLTDEGDDRSVPPWAIRVVLDETDIRIL